MIEREEIREVIDAYTDDGCLYPDKDCAWCSKEGYCASDNDSYACLMKRLDGLGVVIKEDCPKCHGIGVFYRGEPVEVKCGRCKGTGYVATEYLIEEE